MHRLRSQAPLALLISSQILLATPLCLVAKGLPPAARQQTPAPSPAPNPDSPTTSNPANADPAPDPAAKKPKKVWTNEEVSGMHSQISVVGNGRNPKAKPAAPAPADPAYVAYARKELEKLRGQMAAADKELASLKDFSEGEPVSTADREFHKSYNSEPIAQQIAKLQAKKLDLQSKIDALLDEARKRGIDPGQLR